MSADFYHDDPVDVGPQNKKSKPHVLLLILAIFGGGFFLQNTFASNISLNSSSPVVFGQGILQTVSCSGVNQSLTVTPFSTFSNSSGGGSYYLESMTVSDIPSGCNNLDFKINAFGNTSSSPLALFNTTSTDAVIWNNAGTFEAGAGSTGMSVTSRSGSFSIRFNTPVALSTSVFKITIQSSAHNSGASPAVTYNVGDTGPGGGKIIYASSTPFTETGTACSTSCYYLEVAPTGWNGGADPTRPWAQSTPVDYTSTSLLLTQAFGNGKTNTSAIIAQGNSNSLTSAAALATSYNPTVNGVSYNDWFLPSEGEQAYIVAQRIPLGIGSGGYWNSSSVAITNGRYYNFTSYGYAGNVKATLYYVRPIRAF